MTLMQDQGQGINSADISKLYKQVEGKLESIVEKLLISKMNDNDNILQSVQTMMEKIFIASAMKISANNVSQASKLLGINRNTLSKKLKEIQQRSQK
jgi:DNA-binding protein Fis